MLSAASRAVFKPSRRPCSSPLLRASIGSAPAREVAQIGAVLGRDFVYALLRDVAEIDEPALQASLDRLADADLLFVEGAPPEANYRFKHALIQDAAYDSLLKSRRQALHRRAAEVLRRERNGRARSDRPSFHPGRSRRSRDRMVGQGGRPGAAPLGVPGGDRPSRQGDRDGGQGGRDGAASARRLGRSEPATDAVARRPRQTRSAPRAGCGAPETTEAFARARESASGDKDAPERLAADFGLWAGSYVRGELPSMRAHAAAFLSDLEARPDSPEAGVAHRAAGITCWFAGDYREARDHLERALALFQPGRDDDLAFRFGQDPGVAAMANLAVASWPLGEVDRAISLIDRMQDAGRGPDPCRHARVREIATRPCSN